MLPRKRQRPNPADTKTRVPDSSPVPSTSVPASASDHQQQQQQMPPPTDPNRMSHETPLKQVRKSQSWYGSWPLAPKAPPSTSVARENILGGSVKSGKTPDLSRFDMRKDSDASSLHSPSQSVNGLSRIPENGSKDSQPGANSDYDSALVDSEVSQDSPRKPEEAAQLTRSATNEETPQQPTTSSGWLGWWSRTPFTETQAAPNPQASPAEEHKDVAPQRPSTPVAQVPGPETLAPETPSNPPRSWFGFWAGGTPTTPGKPDQQLLHDADSGADTGRTDATEDQTMSEAPPPTQQKLEPAPKAGSTWAFWSKDSPKSKGIAPNQESGEIAVMGEGSEAHPQPMTEGDVTPSKDTKNKKDGQASGMLTWRRNTKRVRPSSMDIDAASSIPSGTSTPQEQPQPQQPQQPTEQTQPPPKADSSSKSVAESEAATKLQPNLLLPSFSSTYQMKQDPSIIKQIAQLVLRSQEPPINHVFRVKEPPKIRKAIAIGVHGLFPATFLRPMIGQPTGTSLRFANLCADAIRRWTDQHGSRDCEIEKVALEGEGKINERVDNLWKLMLNWIDHIRHADLILIACHSQGVPVSVMLLEKLIDLGIITNAKIGVCAMAGVGLGPFPEYKSGILMGSAAELWEFGNPDSTNSLRYEAALKRILEYGARITFIGSIDDQLVPMESAVYSPASHPYIYRAVFIDGRVHAPDFIAHLVGFALKLRNLGISDHGLIRELSLPLAGSLYSGEGHSRIYYDDQVYDLAVAHALETTSVGGRDHLHPACDIRHRRGHGAVLGGQQGSQQAQAPNPYVLPWIMRGLLEEDFVKTELSQETEELLQQFDDWKPSNKALKDVKYRLEAVRSKL